MSRVTDRQLLQKLKEQRDYLISEVSEYENGKTHFAYKIAATLRTIFSRTETSSPILPDLADKYGYPFTLKGRNPPPKGILLYVGFPISLGVRDRELILNDRSLVAKKFEQYWDEVVYIDPVAHYKRSQLVLWAANKLGGTHVDPMIPRRLQHLVGGEIRIESQAYGEESIINHVVYEMGLQVMVALDTLIPYLQSKTVDERREEVTVDSLRTYVESSDEVRYWNDFLRTEPSIAHKVGSWGDLSRDVRIANFCGLHSIEEIDATLKRAHGWGADFFRRYYKRFFEVSGTTPKAVSTVVNGTLTQLLIASYAEKFTPETLNTDFGFGSVFILEIAREARSGLS